MWYYVTMIRGKRVAWLSGPFSQHLDALNAIEESKRRAIEIDPFHDFDAFGTASLKTEIKTAFGTLEKPQ